MGMTLKSAPLADLWSGAVTMGLAACGLFFLLDAWAPPQDLPWKPLDLRQPLGRATAAKIARLDIDDRASPERVAAATTACLNLLRDAGVEAQRAEDRNDGGFCVVRGAVRLTGGDMTPISPAGLTMRCPVAVRHILWDRHVVQPAAREIMGTEPRRIDSLGVYACRRVYGSQDQTARPSQHARANAVDVAGVRLADGRTVSVLRDWDGRGPAGDEGGAFLRRLRDGGCRLFGNVLTPDYNAAHRDHFHLDAAARGVCARAGR
ncbi:extensin family protein [Brevundimonas sp.]|uniref:extensin-like domain-containing protein n=1 Tax=Brevundimonas sp. TaxID=1871086 RepID=UPI00289D34F8|nr:extensin family protein [Brevundimonas sp.]